MGSLGQTGEKNPQDSCHEPSLKTKFFPTTCKWSDSWISRFSSTILLNWSRYTEFPDDERFALFRVYRKHKSSSALTEWCRWINTGASEWFLILSPSKVFLQPYSLPTPAHTKVQMWPDLATKHRLEVHAEVQRPKRPLERCWTCRWLIWRRREKVVKHLESLKRTKTRRRILMRKLQRNCRKISKRFSTENFKYVLDVRAGIFESFLHPESNNHRTSWF